MIIEPAPCPFCGGTDIKLAQEANAGHGDTTFINYYWCPCCDCRGPRQYNRSKELDIQELVNNWNKRYTE